MWLYFLPCLIRFWVESHNKIIKHLCHLPEFYNRTINPRTIVSGFELCGMWPFDAEKMLARCDKWHEFDEEEQQLILGVIQKLARLLSKGPEKLYDEMILVVQIHTCTCTRTHGQTRARA